MSEKEEGHEEYGASSIQVLEGLEAVRKRPAMYIGDISEKGLHHLVYEVVDNSIDEALAGFCTHIEVTINKDNSITVVDNGRGIPVDLHEKEHKSALEVVLTVLHAGGKFNKDSYKVSGGLHGVGVSCVNALSTYLRAEVRRDGKRYVQEYSCGKPTTELRIEGEASDTGTSITFRPDPSIFTVTVYDYNTLANRLRDLAFLNAGITLTLTDLRGEEPRKEVFYSKNGLREFVEYIDKNKEPLINDVIHLQTERSGIPVEVALTYNSTYNENIYSFVNNINTIEGGTHLTGFRRGLTQTLKKYAEDNKLLEKVKVEISGDDFREGLTAVISVKVMEPQFEGQTKTKLGNSEVIGAVQTAVSEALRDYLEENPRQAKAIVENQEITSLFRALRVTVGTPDDPKAVNINKLAYHKIVIMTDADVDGSHIDTLLMTFFFRRMRPVIENGYLYIATPPLYKCKCGKVEDYCWTEAQVQQFIERNGSRTKVQRYKGLGEMSAEELRDTTMDPEQRLLKQVTISDAAEADRIFSMLMGEDVGPRRDFIEANANIANVDA